MSTDLREELDALARTQTFSPDPSAWDRGRRARRRSHLARGAAVLVVLASVGGGAALWSAPDREARTTSTQSETPYPGMIPRRIEDPGSGSIETDLAVGRASVAFVSRRTGTPVVIGARDGAPHRLELSGWREDDQGLALSPDGLRLAWQDMDADGATIRVADLLTGTTAIRRVDPDENLRLRELTWSPDSVWLAWIGDADGGAHVGRLRPVDVPITESWFVEGNIPDVAISDDARLVVSRPDRGLYWLQGDAEPVRLTDADLVGAGAFSPDREHVALRSAPGTSSYTLDVESREVLEHPFPDSTFGESVVRPLGWLDDRLQLLLVQPVDGSAPELVVTTPEVDDTSTWRGRVGAVEPSVGATLSLAVDLVPDLDGTSSQQLTHDFGDTVDDPPAPLGIELSLFIGLGVAVAIALLMALRWLWRRLS